MSDGVERLLYGAFNDPLIWEEFYKTGELPASMRNLLDDPLESGLSLWHVHKWAETANEERNKDAMKVDKYGLVVLQKRLTIEFPWEPVSPDEVEKVRNGRV